MFGFKKKKEQETEAKALEFRVETMKDALQISKKGIKVKTRLGKQKFFSFFEKERKKEKLHTVQEPFGRSVGPFSISQASSAVKPRPFSQSKQQSAIKPRPKAEPPIPPKEKVEKEIEKVSLVPKPKPQVPIAQKPIPRHRVERKSETRTERAVPHKKGVVEKVDEIHLPLKPRPRIPVTPKPAAQPAPQHKVERKYELVQDKKVSTKIEKYETVGRRKEKFREDDRFQKIIGKPLQQQKHHLERKKPVFRHETKRQDAILQKKDTLDSFTEKKSKEQEPHKQIKTLPSYISEYPIKHKSASPKKTVIKKKEEALKIPQKKDAAPHLERQKEDWTKLFGTMTNIPEELKQEPALPDFFGSKKPLGSLKPKTESHLQHKKKVEEKTVEALSLLKPKPRIPAAPRPVPRHRSASTQSESKHQAQQSHKPPEQFISRQGPFVRLYTQTKQYKPPEQLSRDQEPAGLKQKYAESSQVKPKSIEPSPAKSEKPIEPDHAKPKFVERKPAKQISQALRQTSETSPRAQIAQKQETGKQFGAEQASVDKILQKLKSTKLREAGFVPVPKAHSRLIQENLRHKAVKDTLKRIKDFEKTIKKSEPATKTKPAGHVLNLKEEKEKPKVPVSNTAKLKKAFSKKPFGEDKYPVKKSPKSHIHGKKQRVSEILSTKLAKYRTSLGKRKEKDAQAKTRAQLNIGDTGEIVDQPQGRLNKPLLIIAVILLFLTGGSGYFYYKHVLKKKPVENIPFISDINISDKLDDLFSEKQGYEKQIAILEEANSQQFSRNKMSASIKTYILSIKKTPKKAVELRNGFFIRPCDENNNRMTAIDIFNSLNIELPEVYPYLDDDAFFFIIHNKKKALNDPITIKINLLLKIKNDSMEDEIAEIIKSVEPVLPTEFQTLYLDEKKPIVPRSIVFKSVPCKSGIVSQIHYFNYVAGDTTKSIEWSILTANNSKYLAITTSKHATDSMILEFE